MAQMDGTAVMMGTPNPPYAFRTVDIGDPINPFCPPPRREPGWHWRNCRSIDLLVIIHPLPQDWRLGAWRDDDYSEGQRYLNLGPLSLGLRYSIGNSSEEGWRAKTALSETEAWDRACRWEGIVCS